MLVIRLRAAVPEDERRLAFLDRTTWSPTNSPVPLWDESVDFFASDPVGDVIVAELRGIPVGYVKLRSAVAEDGSVADVSISGIAVDPGYQRQGIGSLLLAEAVDEARRRGAVRLSLHVLGTNEPAIGLYSSHGFAVTTIRRGAFLLAGASVDDLTMERAPTRDRR